MEYHLGRAIQTLRKKRSFSQGDVAAELQVSVQAVSKWENEKANPDLTLLPRLAELFGVSIDELFSAGVEVPVAGEILGQNSNGWNQIAQTEWAGTHLPSYGPYTPTEETLCLLGDVRGKAVLELACGSGESLIWMAERGAKELWGLDISETRIEQAKSLLKIAGQKVRLFFAAMETNPGIPRSHFDIVYSIYGLGWTTNLESTIAHVQEYLKPGGQFVFSWDNPLMQCVDAVDGQYVLSRSYTEERKIEIQKMGISGLRLKNWRLSSYLNCLAEHGFLIQKVIEESAYDPAEADNFREGKYYSAGKARLINPVVIVKAKKL